MVPSIFICAALGLTLQHPITQTTSSVNLVRRAHFLGAACHLVAVAAVGGAKSPPCPGQPGWILNRCLFPYALLHNLYKGSRAADVHFPALPLAKRECSQRTRVRFNSLEATAWHAAGPPVSPAAPPPQLFTKEKPSFQTVDKVPEPFARVSIGWCEAEKKNLTLIQISSRKILRLFAVRNSCYISFSLITLKKMFHLLLRPIIACHSHVQ